MMNSIPASQLVNVIPSVLGAGGNALSLNAVFLTQDPSIPIGTAQPFSTEADVSDWFGPNAPETALAQIYFSGFIGCTQLPGTLYFAQFNTSGVAAYLRGGSVIALTLAQLQALSGTLDVTINGAAVASASINLSAATSFTLAASLITTGLQTVGGIFSGTGSQAAGVVTIASTVTGQLHIGDTLTGAGVEPSTTILSFGTYTPTAGTGTVNVSSSGTVSLGAIDVTSTAVVTYDTLRDSFVITSPTTGAASTIGYATGSIAAGLEFTQATGAVISAGAASNTPAGVMAQVVAATQNWATFMTVTEMTLSNKEAFAAWVQGTNSRYCYMCQDSDVSALSAGASGSFGAIVNANDDFGVVPIFDTTGGNLAAFACSVAASIDFTAKNGRTTWAYRGQAGLTPQITDATIANNLKGNGYNYYAQYATAAQQFQEFQNGQISGSWKWIDPYINQIWMNSNFQLALMVYQQQAKSTPYNVAGLNALRQVLSDPINQALNFGAIQPGVTLSASQAISVNTAAGVNISNTIQNVGYYLQVLQASPTVRSARGSPPMTFWYTDGGSIQNIQLASIDLE
jgi:Protein of unknown function (DUF3383)